MCSVMPIWRFLITVYYGKYIPKEAVTGNDFVMHGGQEVEAKSVETC